MVTFISIVAENAMILLTALTVILLLYYTKETYLLRKEAQNQTSAAFTPYITLRSFENCVHISNLGKGIAKDIRFEPFSVGDNPICNVPTIAPEEKRELRVLDAKEGGYWSLQTRDTPDVISLQYSDLLRNTYFASFQKRKDYQGTFIEISQNKKKSPL